MCMFLLSPPLACPVATGPRRRPAAEALPAGASGGGTRWYRVGNRVGTRSQWKRPFGFPILWSSVHLRALMCLMALEPTKESLMATFAQWLRDQSNGDPTLQ